MSSISTVPVSSRVSSLKPSIWLTMNEKINQLKPLNLGQGCPNYPPCKQILQSLRDTAESGESSHQLTREQGHMRLVNVLSTLYTPYTRHNEKISGPCSDNLLSDTFEGSDRQIHPEREIVICIGAYGALSTIFYAIVNPGDEVIIIEPSFDCYTPMTIAVGGIPIYTCLKPDENSGVSSSADFKLDFTDLESKISEKTRVLVLNTPNNPLGKVFSLEELQKIASLCIQYNLICISDEVYEWMVFPPNKHIKIASLPGMWERTLTIGSGGKAFNVTGWRIGWTIGPEQLITAMKFIQTNSIQSCPTPLQEALARSLEVEVGLLNTPDSYFFQCVQHTMENMKKLSSAFSSVGMQPIYPQAGYFLMVNIEQIASTVGISDAKRDFVFNDWMIINKGISGIPPSVFYSSDNRAIGEKFLRFCFIRDDKTIEQAIDILSKW